jgi:hypothetical protein
VLPELAGLRLSESAAQRTTEAAGARLGQLLEDGQTLGFPKHWSWQRDAQGRTCAYISVDATGVRQQGPGGTQADGRLPYVAMVYNPVPDLPAESPDRPPPGAAMQARYLAGLYDLPALGLQLRRQAGQVGMDRADRWIGVTDGGAGLEHFLRVNFPRDLVLILDFWHPAEDLAELARLLHPTDEARAQEQARAWCQVMKAEGGAGIVRVLEALPLPPRQKAVREKHAAVLGYLRHNLHRMDYPTYLANGWLIGSGAVESACKTVVGQRLKLAGMRWSAEGADALCHLRALFRSEPGQWPAFWRRQVNQPSRN